MAYLIQYRSLNEWAVVKPKAGVNPMSGFDSCSLTNVKSQGKLNEITAAFEIPEYGLLETLEMFRTGFPYLGWSVVDTNAWDWNSLSSELKAHAERAYQTRVHR